jgi:hypothetical protein
MVSRVSFLDENARRDPDYRLPRPHPDRHPAAGQRKLILKLGPLVDAVKPGFHGVRTHWIRGFMAFRLAPHIRTVRLTVPM